MFSWKRPGPAEWLVVGLGNPGPKYDAEVSYKTPSQREA